MPAPPEPRIVSVYAVFADAEEAARISRILVEERLAACANLLSPCASIYRWEGRIEEAREAPALFKTRAETAPLLIERLAALHSYEVPAAVTWEIIYAPEDYARWVCEEVIEGRGPDPRP